MSRLTQLNSGGAVVFLLALVLLFHGYAAAGIGGYGYNNVTPDSPVIEQALAADFINPGTTWHLYLWVTDPNKDISVINYEVMQPGGQDYSPGHLKVTPGRDGKLAGYLYLNTISLAFETAWQAWYTVRITVDDSAGNRSLPREFKVYFYGRSEEDVRRWERKELSSMGLEEPPLISRIHTELIPLGGWALPPGDKP